MDNGNDITIDASPSAPRDKPVPNSDNIDNSNDNSHYGNYSPSYKKPKSKKPSSTKRSSACVINICNASNIHIGSNTYYNYSDSNTNKTEKCKSEILENDAIRSLFASEEPVTRDHIILVARHMGAGWRNTIRALDYTEGFIDQFYEDFHSSGVQEVITKLLIDWIQHEPLKATVGKLSKTMWDTDQRGVVQEWSAAVCK